MSWTHGVIDLNPHNEQRIEQTTKRKLVIQGLVLGS